MDWEIRQRIAALSRGHEQLAKQINDVFREREQDRNSAFIEQSRQLLADMYRESVGYANVITLAGYAGIFAIWQLTDKYLRHTVRLWVATLLTSSLLFFAAYEVYKMVRNAWHLRQLQKVLDLVPKEKAVEGWRVGLVIGYMREVRIWLYFLVPTVVTGFAAGFLLLLALVQRVFNGG